MKYQEMTKDGMPRFPVYVGLRPDGNPNAPLRRARSEASRLRAAKPGKIAEKEAKPEAGRNRSDPE